MSYKTILVHLDVSKKLDARLEVAFDLAQRFDAHVAGLYALDRVELPAYAVAESSELAALSRKVHAEMRERTHGVWEAAVKRSGWSKSEWRHSEADALDAMTLHARYADLIVLGQDDGEGSSGVSDRFEQKLLLAAGRPVLMVPYAREKRSIGDRALVSWNASREAARAVKDALPFLKAAKQVDVATFNAGRTADPHGEVPGADVAAYLSRHGVKVSVSQFFTDESDIGGQLLSRAADLDSDLIVMGAYGHSRLAEMILGGATRTILESMTVPVLLSH